MRKRKFVFVFFAAVAVAGLVAASRRHSSFREPPAKPAIRRHNSASLR
jgi:hypothetical protein